MYCRQPVSVLALHPSTLQGPVLPMSRLGTEANTFASIRGESTAVKRVPFA